jgi:G:T-mismatch repair DNA endonuclease (very short patch repair protein)
VCNYKDKDWLYQKYSVEGLSLHEIAKIFEVDAHTIRYWMKKFEIPIRKRVEALKAHFEESRVCYFNICENCGSTFKVNGYTQTRKDTKAYVGCCSDQCRKELTARKKFKGHNFRRCPNCSRYFRCNMQSMMDSNSSKFRKFCSRKCNLSSRKQCDTWIETEILQFLTDKGVELEVQSEIGRMTIDFKVSGTNILIEANGDFWHANPSIYGKEKPLHKIHPRVIAKDKRKLEELNNKGYKVFVVWENDLKVNRDNTLDKLYQDIKDAI